MAAAAASSSLQARQMTNHMQGLLLIQYLLAVVSGEMHHTELQMGKAFIVIQAVLALAAGSEVPSSPDMPGKHDMAVNVSRASWNERISPQ